ncbi:MAG: type III-B CRISPR module RAMP protein Cmr4 [Spirochaetaceae bacterium]|nr:type III-B CRISPR module RAMP protein Cmr4 [Spirochaetaceae bacterium]
MFENTSIAIMYAVTPCHAGSGSSLGVVDLPIQRERHTNWPMIQASGVKGAFRANFERFKNNIPEASRGEINEFEKLTDSVFGTSEGTGYAGSLSIGDARILAFPMRSNVSPFVWITCPAVIRRLKKDLEIAGMDTSGLPEKMVADGNAVSIGSDTINAESVLLEDFEVKISKAEVLPDSIKKYFDDATRLLLVPDEVFDYGVSNCTQIMAQIKIDSKTGTTEDGSLRYQEELPSDTVMYTVVHWGDSRNGAEDKLKALTIKGFVTDEVIKSHIQIAGDETCGRGIFHLNWYHNN